MDGQNGPTISDNRLSESKQDKAHPDLQKELALQERAQAHAHSKDDVLTEGLLGGVRFYQRAYSWISGGLIAAIVVFVCLLVFAPSVSAGMGFSLGILTSAFGIILKHLLEKISDLSDIHRHLPKS